MESEKLIYEAALRAAERYAEQMSNAPTEAEVEALRSLQILAEEIGRGLRGANL